MKIILVEKKCSVRQRIIILSVMRLHIDPNKMPGVTHAVTDRNVLNMSTVNCKIEIIKFHSQKGVKVWTLEAHLMHMGRRGNLFFICQQFHIHGNVPTPLCWSDFIGFLLVKPPHILLAIHLHELVGMCVLNPISKASRPNNRLTQLISGKTVTSKHSDQFMSAWSKQRMHFNVAVFIFPEQEPCV